MSNKHHDRREPAEATAVNSVQADGGEEVPASSGDRDSGAPASASGDSELEVFRKRSQALEAQVATLSDEASSLKNQYLRSLADYENFRKRMFRDREDSLKYSNLGLLGDLVPLLDDFDRAISSAEHAQDYRTLHDGIVLIRRQIGSVLENKYGLTRFESLGKPFDPNVHEAVASETGEVEDAVVSMEFLPGYRLHDRMVRSAKVRVKMPAPMAASQPSAETKPVASSDQAETAGEVSSDAGPVPAGAQP
jgi:molecular chaperone GrpE